MLSFITYLILTRIIYQIWVNCSAVRCGFLLHCSTAPKLPNHILKYMVFLWRNIFNNKQEALALWYNCWMNACSSPTHISFISLMYWPYVLSILINSNVVTCSCSSRFTLWPSQPIFWSHLVAWSAAMYSNINPGQ